LLLPAKRPLIASAEFKIATSIIDRPDLRRDESLSVKCTSRPNLILFNQCSELSKQNFAKKSLIAGRKRELALGREVEASHSMPVS